MKFSIFNFQFSKKKKIFIGQPGFTLIELLAIMFVFITLSSLLVGILVSTLRTSNKTNTLNVVQQNGQFAITQMAKIIRNARNLDILTDCSGVPIQTISVTTSDLLSATFSCTGTNIASNGADLLDTTSVRLTSCQFTCTQSSPTDYPIIDINFSLSQAGPSTFIEQRASASAIPFQTSIVLRNLSR